MFAYKKIAAIVVVLFSTKSVEKLGSEIRHPRHPEHPIYLFDFHLLSENLCDLCGGKIGRVFGYRCSSCDVDLDIACKKLGADGLLEERKELQHPSHPDHPLTLMRKPAFAFDCDACGEQDVDMAYICSTCEFWVHKACASLPLLLQCQHHHHHLSLAFSFPMEHRKFGYICDVCDKYTCRTNWVYFCGDCRYFVHLKCVGIGSSSTTKPHSNSLNEDNDDDDRSDVIQFPLSVDDISKELITPFVMREKEVDAGNSLIFNYHEHPLSLVSEEEDKDDEEEDELKKICDVCVTPISSPPYYKCVACRSYFIHSICYLLPKTLRSSSPDSHLLLQLYGDCEEIPNKNHKFTLYTSWESINGEASYWWCDLCGFLTNGMGYECEECNMKIDVKCASLPTTIRHASHPQHHHKPLILTRILPPQEGGIRKECHVCDRKDFNIAYCCNNDGCDFALELRCAQMPLSITEHEWRGMNCNHPLLLTFDASLDHPSDFFCEFCEREIHPKVWMHHCRQCDISVHLYCLRNASGVYRNIKFGRRFVLDAIHPHPLTFNSITLKKRCHLCHCNVYTYLGFECTSCYYIVCWYCVRAELRKITREVRNRHRHLIMSSR